MSSSYWDGNPLHLARGETKIVKLNLQNMVGDEDVRVKAILHNGGEIAELDGEIFNVLAHTSDSIAPLKITIPRDYSIGRLTRVGVEFKTIPANDAGSVAMGTGMGVAFDVIVSEGEIVKPKIGWAAGIILFIVALIIIIIIIIIKRKKQSSTNFK